MTDAADDRVDDADASAIDEHYVKAIHGDPCGNWGAHVLYYRNIHPRRRIRITIRHHWIYEGETREEPPYTVVLEPNLYGGAVPTDKDARMGCPIPGPTTQRFNWDVIKAEWA